MIKLKDIIEDLQLGKVYTDKDRPPFQTSFVNEGKFSNDQIEIMRKAYGTLKTMNPTSPTYKKFIKFLGKLPKDQLKQLAGANIKWISMLAKNRIKGESVNEGLSGSILTKVKKNSKDVYGRTDYTADGNQMSYYSGNNKYYIVFHGKKGEVTKYIDMPGNVNKHDKAEKFFKDFIKKYDRTKKLESVNEGKFGKFDTGAAFKGNGMTIYDRNQEKSGDYKNIAHISEDGKLTIWDKNIKKEPKLMQSLKKISQEFKTSFKESVNEATFDSTGIDWSGEMMWKWVSKALKSAGIKELKYTPMKSGWLGGKFVWGGFYKVQANKRTDVLPITVDKKGKLWLNVSPKKYIIGKIGQLPQVVYNLKDFKKSDLDVYESVNEKVASPFSNHLRKAQEEIEWMIGEHSDAEDEGVYDKPREAMKLLQTAQKSLGKIK